MSLSGPLPPSELNWQVFCVGEDQDTYEVAFILEGENFDDESKASGSRDITAYIERTGWRPPGAKGDERWHLNAVYLVATGGAAFTVYVGGHDSPGESFTYDGPYTWTPASGEDKINCRVKARRYLAYKIVYPAQAAGSISAIGLDVTPVGSR